MALAFDAIASGSELNQSINHSHSSHSHSHSSSSSSSSHSSSSSSSSSSHSQLLTDSYDKIALKIGSAIKRLVAALVEL
jgi:hypothetical protein